MDYSSAIYHLRRRSADSGAQAAGVSSFVSLSLGLNDPPVMTALLEGLSASLTGQLAVKMSADTLVEQGLQLAGETTASDSLAMDIVRAGLRTANTRVYEYAHQMAASGQIGARGIVSVYDGASFAIASAGQYESFLWRDGNLLRFNAEAADSGDEQGVLQRFIGANAKILVDLGSVAVRDGDLVVLTTLKPSAEMFAVAVELCAKRGALDQFAEELLVAAGECEEGERDLMAAVFQIGEPTIELSQVVEEG